MLVLWGKTPKMTEHIYKGFRDAEKKFDCSFFDKIECVSDKKEEKITELLKSYFTASCSHVCDLTMQIKKKYNEEIVIYKLRTQKFCTFGGHKISFQETEDVFQLFDVFFKNRNQKLLFVPDIDLIFDNLLYKTTDDGQLKDISDTGSYQGEVGIFLREFISKLKSPNGLMLKNYSNQHFVTLLSEDSVQPGEFETDWLYIGNEKIIVIEIGLSDTKQQTKNSNCSTISNKITQVLERTIPHFQAILFSLFTASEKQKTEKEIDFIMRVFQVVILLPNITFSQFQEAVDKLKTKQGQSKLFNLLEFNEQFWSTNLFIVLQQDEQSEYIFRIDKNLALCSIKRRATSDLLGCLESTNWANLESKDSMLSKTNSFSDLFSSKSSSQSEIFREISALITLSSLNAIELSQDKLSNRDVDERYRKSFKNWKPKQSNLTYTGQDFILSPEQHRILSNADLSFLLISGEPGSGKTSLLLAKCQMLAEDDDVKIIYFLVNHRKVSFLDFLKRIIDKNGSDLLKNKMIIIAVEEDYLTSLP